MLGIVVVVLVAINSAFVASLHGFWWGAAVGIGAHLAGGFAYSVTSVILEARKGRK